MAAGLNGMSPEKLIELKFVDVVGKMNLSLILDALEDTIEEAERHPDFDKQTLSNLKDAHHELDELDILHFDTVEMLKSSSEERLVSVRDS